jgi:hypothetical protein
MEAGVVSDLDAASLDAGEEKLIRVLWGRSSVGFAHAADNGPAATGFLRVEITVRSPAGESPLDSASPLFHDTPP